MNDLFFDVLSDLVDNQDQDKNALSEICDSICFDKHTPFSKFYCYNPKSLLYRQEKNQWS